MDESGGFHRLGWQPRVVVAALLILLAIGGVAAMIIVESPGLLVAVASAAGVAICALAALLIHGELRETRLDAAEDSAFQAQEYAELSQKRTAENVAFAADVSERLAKRDVTINRLEGRLVDTAMELADTRRELDDVRHSAASAPAVSADPLSILDAEVSIEPDEEARDLVDRAEVVQLEERLDAAEARAEALADEIDALSDENETLRASRQVLVAENDTLREENKSLKEAPEPRRLRAVRIVRSAD